MTSAIAAPLTTPTISSLVPSLRHCEILTSRSARPRIVTASAWLPLFPDCPATTGSSTASAVTWAMVPSKIPTTAAARKAVTRLMNSQGSRLRTENIGLLRARSSRPTPTMACRSVVASSSAAEVSRLRRIKPSSLPSTSTTLIPDRDPNPSIQDLVQVRS